MVNRIGNGGKIIKKPNLFIVGAPRCGTTSLYRYLGQHPDIFMSSEKELNFFASDLYLPQFTESEYLSFFAGAKKEL